MRTITTTLYTYDELPTDEARSRARDWYREASNGDTFYAECTTDEFRDMLKALGFTVDARRGISWSGFWSQGDGASFAGSWYASDYDAQQVAKLREDMPRECQYHGEDGMHQNSPHVVAFHDAADTLARLVARFPESSGRVATGRDHFMSKTFDHGEDVESEFDVRDTEAQGDTFADAVDTLARGFYRTLEAEWEYQNSDEAVAETIRANEYEFTEDGECA